MQLTVHIDDSLLLAAKKHAHETGRTVDEVVRDLMAREVGWSGPEGAASLEDERVLSVLRTYSEGRTTRRRAMDEIGLAPDQYSDFVDLMQRLRVPWPQVDRKQIERQAEIVAEAIEEASDEN